MVMCVYGEQRDPGTHGSKATRDLDLTYRAKDPTFQETARILAERLLKA